MNEEEFLKRFNNTPDDEEGFMDRYNTLMDFHLHQRPSYDVVDMAGTIPDTPFFHLKFPPCTSSCQQCKKDDKKSLMRCASCHVVDYCSKECQTRNWPDHKPLCKDVKDAFAFYQKEERRLMNCRGVNYFEDPKRNYQFWKLQETRDFCGSVGNLIQVYDMVGTAPALKKCVELAMKYFHHDKSDGYGLRSFVALHLFRLGMDQEAHDYIKWHAEFPKDEYDWNDPTLPYLSYWGTDPRQPNPYISEKPDLYHVMADFLIKFRIYSEKMAFNTLFIASRSPSSQASLGFMHRFDKSVWDNIHCCLTKKHDGKSTTLAELKELLHDYLKLLDDKNQIVCRALLFPKRLLSQPEPHFQHPFLIVREYVGILDKMPAAKEFIRDHCIKVYGKGNLSKYNATIERSFYF